MMKLTNIPFAALSLVLMSILGANASTVSYYRFEDGMDLGLDSGPNSLNLTANAATSVPATGFPNPIPQTGAANALATGLNRANTAYYSTADASAFSVQDFTIEAYVKADSISGNAVPRIIASQYGSNDYAWYLGLAGNTSSLFSPNELFISLSANGTSSTLLGSGFTLNLTDIYYLAAAVDFTGSGVTTTFYFKNITTGGSLQTFVASSSAISSLYDSSADFMIGTNAVNVSNYAFNGTLDEVRLSNIALAETELLEVAAVPETSSAALLASGLVLAGFFQLRRKKGRYAADCTNH